MSTEIPLKNAATEQAKVQKVHVNIPAPYKTGHKLRANEASALNAYYVNCIRNAVAADAKAKVDEAGGEAAVDPAVIQKLVDDVVAEYDFGQTGTRGGDPVEREALEIARNSVRQAIRKKGANVSDYATKAITAKAKEILATDKHGKAIREKARQIVANREELADIDI